MALPKMPESKSQMSLFFANGTAGELIALSLKLGLITSVETPGVPGLDRDPPLAFVDEDELVLAPRWRTCCRAALAAGVVGDGVDSERAM